MFFSMCHAIIISSDEKRPSELSTMCNIAQLNIDILHPDVPTGELTIC